MKSIFLSHNHKDKNKVRALAKELESYGGVRVWLDEAEMCVGDSLIRKIEKAINEVDYLVVALSPDSVKSEWVNLEVEIALNQEIAGKQIKVLPVLVRDCEVPDFLKSKVYADIRDRDTWKSGARLIGKAIGYQMSTDSYELVKLKGEHFLDVVNKVAAEFPQWELLWEKDIFGLFLSDHQDYNRSLFIEPVSDFGGKGFHLLKDEWEIYDALILRIGEILESKLNICIELPRGYDYQLSSIWSQGALLNEFEIDPNCDVILEYTGQLEYEH